MKHKLLNILLALLLIAPGASMAKQKVACIGNSITEGLALQDFDRYPTVLQRLLGSTDFEVRNFGASGSTLLQGTEYPYRTSTQFSNAKAWKPDVIIVKLGTNDLKPHNWIYKDNYVKDYIDLINIFKALNSNLKVFVCYPVPAQPNNWLEVEDEVLTNVMVPMINSVAEQTGATVIDLHTPLLGHDNFIYDKIHPNERGHTMIAHTVARALCPTCEIEAIPAELSFQLSNFALSDRRSSFTSSLSSEVNIASLTDRDPNTGISIPFSENVSFTFEMSENVKLTGYTLTTGKSDVRNFPKNWKVEGSNTGRLWFKIEERVGMQFWEMDTKVYETPFTTLDALSAYKYIKITIEGNNGGEMLNINEIQLFGLPLTLETSITNNGGVITGEFDGFTGEKVENLIDRQLNTKYCVVEKGPGWVQYNSSTKTKIKRYTLTSCYDDYNRNPRSWQLLGSNDGSKWDVLDERTNEDFVTRFHMMEFPVQSNEEYTMFRLKLTRINIGYTFQFSEFQLFANEGVSSIDEEKEQGRVTANDGKIYIQPQDGISLEYKIYSLSGECVKSGNTHAEIVIDGYPSGIYFVQLNSILGTSTVKIII